jgi:transposase
MLKRMRILNYKESIQEDVDQLLSIEKKQKESRLRDRVRFVRLLKEGKVTTQVEAGAMIGLKRRQSQKLWKLYKQEGLSSLLILGYKGSWAKLDSVQQARLLQRLDSDDLSTQQQVIDWIKAEMGITYTQSGISLLLARLKVKLKTGRPVNVRKDQAGEQRFKKTLSR